MTLLVVMSSKGAMSSMNEDEKLIEVDALIKLQRLNINDVRESVGSNGVKGVNSRESSWS